MKPLRHWKEDQYPMSHFRNELSNLFQRFFDEPFSSQSFWNKGQSSPALNVIEKKDRYIVEVEIPGMKREDIDITVESGTLTIKGEKQQEKQSEDEQNTVHVFERTYGSFQRSLTLPKNAKEEAISAQCKDGILYVDIPKNKDNSKRIEIR